MVDAEEIHDQDGDANEDEQDPAEKEENKYQNLDPVKRERVKEVFQIFDKEQQGFIDTESLGTLLRWLNFNPTESEMLEFVDTYD